MNKVIDCICRLLPNKVLITIPTLNDKLYVVVGLYNLDSDSPIIMVKKDEPDARATLSVPINKVGSIIVNDFGNGKQSKN